MRSLIGCVGRVLSITAMCFFAFAATAEAGTPKIRTLTEQELDDLVVGSGIYCTRNFNTQAGIDQIHKRLQEGKKFTMIDLRDLPNNWIGFTTFGVGGGGAWPEVSKRYEGQDLKPDANPKPEDVLGQYLGKKFQATFTVEVGQIVTTLDASARLGIPVIDGDPASRCVPEVQMNSLFMTSGITKAPFAGVTRFGDVIIVPKVRDEYRSEDIMRGLAVASGGGVSMAANALSGEVLKKNLVGGAHSQSMRAGRAAREAVAAGQDPVEAVARAGGGYILFRGKVTRSDTKGDHGFGWTEAYLSGIGPFSGSEYKIYNKNENMIAWRDGKLDASAPDLIVPLDPKTGWAMRSSREIGAFPVGDELAIVGFPAVPFWRTAKAVASMDPHHFGFTDDFVPLEKLHGAPVK